MWAHESRADLGPLRFSTHERNGVGLESVLRENFSLGFSLNFLSDFISLEIREFSFLALVWPAMLLGFLK